MKTDWNDEEQCWKAVRKNGENIKYVKNPSDAMVMEALRQDAYNIEHTKPQKSDLCMVAIDYDAYALSRIHKQTYRMCEKAVKIEGETICYVNNQTKELCDIAVEQSWWALDFVRPKFMTLELCLKAYAQHKDADQFVPAKIQKTKEWRRAVIELKLKSV